MGTMLLLETLLLVLALPSRIASEEVATTNRYESEYIYQYSFSSEFALNNDITVATSMQVKIMALSGTDKLQRLAVKFSPLALTWHTSEGTRDDEPFGAMEEWFSLYRDYTGHVKLVQYSQSESVLVLSVKKMIANMLSIEDDAIESYKQGQVFVQKFVVEQDGSKKECVKMFTFESNGCLTSVVLTEDIAHRSSIGYTGVLDGIKSVSNLTLTSKDFNSNPSPTAPTNIINDSLTITQTKEVTPLSIVYPIIIKLLSCDPVTSLCQQELIENLNLLSQSDLKILIEQINKSFDAAVMVSLVDAIVLTDVPHLLTDLILSNDTLNDKVLERILHYYSTSVLANLTKVIEVIEEIKRISNMKSVSESIRRKALLTLGAIAKTLKNELPQASMNIIQYLHDSLNKTTSLEQDSILIDSIGNAGDEISQNILHKFAKNNARINIQHTAIRALRHHHDYETAVLLEELAETSTSSLVQHAAVSMYGRHPLAKRELLDNMRSRLQRTRREVASNEYLSANVYNTTMPSVHWSIGFGDDNISVLLERNIHNHFSLQTDPLSTDYKLTMRDEAAFAVDLQLSSGLQHNEFLRTELCLDGKVSYSANMLKDFSFAGVRDQYERFFPLVDGLIHKFIEAYNAISSSQSVYSSVQSEISTALSLVESGFDQSFQHLSQFYTSLALVSNEIDSNNDIFTLSLTLNSTLNDIYNSFMSTKESIPVTLNQLSFDLISVLKPAEQPFISSSLYLPYLRYAPQRALANIYELYWNTENALMQLQSGVDAVKRVTGKFGTNREWTNPSSRLWSTKGNINDIHEMVLLNLSASDSEESHELRTLSDVIITSLEPALSTLLQAPDPLHIKTSLLVEAFQNTTAAFDLLTTAYESTRSTLDTIFGQVVHPGFPVTLKSCDEEYGCGSYPSTAGGIYRRGIDVQGSETVIAPFAGYVKLFDPTSLENSTLFSYNSTNTVILRLTEFSLESYVLILSNINPSSEISHSEIFMKGGSVLGSAGMIAGKATIHLEAYKLINSILYSQDPTQFIPHVLDPTVDISWECNEIVTMIKGMVVDITPVVTMTTSKELVGEPLIDIEVPHEFPQPYEMLIKENHTILSQKNTLFFDSSTSLTIGPVPVTFSFTSFGHYETSVSFEARLFSKQLHVGITPRVQSTVNGTMRVGSATYALVKIEGTLIDTSISLTMQQNFSRWPLSASSSMDLTTRETNMNLTTKLARVTGTGGLSGEEVLDYQVHWQYSIPYINRSEFEQIGTTVDTTGPVFVYLPHHHSTSCRVQQVAGRKYDNPAFELEFAVHELECMVRATYQVSTYEDGSNIIPSTTLYGERIVLAHSLVQGMRLFFTVSVENSNGAMTSTSCQLLVYDSSPPLARVIPAGTFTSHSIQFLVLLSLFDEAVLENEQHVAIGTVPGEEGSDIVNWLSVSTSLITTAPVGSGLNLYSFPMSGRYIDSILSTVTDVDTDVSCADLCTNNPHCLSVDYSVTQKRCILHDSILGPSSTNSKFSNSYRTEPLQVSSDFVHYERLGSSNSTLFIFHNLTLEHRRTFFVNVKLRNVLGYTNTISSEVVTVDLTPPKPGLIRNAISDTVINVGCGFNSQQICTGSTTPVNNHRIIIDGPDSSTVFNGPFQLYDALYTKTNTFISANWNGFHDNESGLTGYTWCISSSSNHSCDIVSYTDPHRGQEQPYWSNSGLSKSYFSDGSYYVTVEAINRVGYGGSLVTTVHHSTPYIVDTTSPVIIGLNVIYYNIELNELSVSFNVNDHNGSGVNQVSIGVGTNPDNVDLLPWTVVAIGDVFGTVNVNVLIPDGVNGWIKLQVTDKVDLKAVSTLSTPINVDRSPPVIGTVSDGSDPFVDIDYQSNLSSICVTWSGFSDPHSHISSYQWTVGVAPGNDSSVSIQNLTEAEIINRLACREVTLIHATTYYSTLIVTNGAELPLAVKGYSDGVTMDTTPPTAGTVIDGVVTDIQYSSSLTHTSFSWEDFTDPESSIQNYKLLIYRTPQSSAIPLLIYTEFVQGNIYSSNHFSFFNGDRIHATVEAFNLVDLSVSAMSNSFLIDLTSPLITYLIDGINVNTDTIYQSSIDSLSASWSATDPQSLISQVDVAFFQFIEGRKVRVYPDGDDPTLSLPISSTNFTGTGLELTNAVKYIFSLTLTNGAGMKSVYETNGVIIDSISPIVSIVSVSGSVNDDLNDHLISTSSSEVHAEWFGTDVGSGVASYLVSVLTEDDIVITTVPSNGVVQRGVIKGLNLTEGTAETGPYYKIRVVAIDHANLSSLAADSTLFWINKGDTVGIVDDGFVSQVDVDYTDEYFSISANFRGFISQECGGFSSYEWAVGFADYQEAVLPFTEQGIVLTSEGEGVAQIYLPDLDQFDSSMLLVTFRGITGCGQTFESVSDGFVISVTPPSVSILQTGPFSIESGPIVESSYQSISSFSSLWRVNDGQQEDTVVTVSVGSYPGASDLMNDTEAQYEYIHEDIIATDGVPSYVTITATNRAGLVGQAINHPIILDTTLPPNGEIMCSKLPNSSCAGVATLQISCQWKGTIDPQSGIERYTVSIATDQLDQTRIFSQEISGNENLFVSPLLTVQTDVKYYVTLYMENGAGLVNILTSTLKPCDSTPPFSTGSVKITPNFANGSYSEGTIEDKQIDLSESTVCVWFTDSLSLSFSHFIDEESSIKEYQLGIGTCISHDDVMNYTIITPTLVSGSYLLQVNNILLEPTLIGPLYFTVRAINSVHLYTDSTSGPVYIKSSTNDRNSWIYDGDNAETDIDFQSSSMYISGTFHYGTNCPLTSLQWGVEGTDGIITKNYTNIPLREGRYLQSDFKFSSDQAGLHNQDTYRLIVRGIDYAGEVHIFRSNGTAVSSQQLQLGNVFDVSPLNLRFQESLSSLSFYITGFGDGTLEQQVLYYEAAVGSNLDSVATRSDIIPFTNLGLQTSYTFDDLDLVSQSQTYYVTVRAHSVSGSIAEVTSTGIVPGYGAMITAGTIVQPSYQSNTSSLKVQWYEFSSDVPILQYEWALSNIRLNSSQLLDLCEDLNDDHSTDFVRGFENVQLSTYSTASKLNLVHNNSYFVILRVLDQASKCKSVTSESATLIDKTPPLGHQSVIGPKESYTGRNQYIAYVTPSNQHLTLSWEEFSDPESPIEFYQVGLYELMSCEVFALDPPVAEYIAVGLNTWYSFESLNLDHNVTYIVKISGTNRAGLTSFILTQPVMLDSYTLTAGNVKDGTSWLSDVVFQSDLTSLSGVFTLAFAQPYSNGTYLNTPCPSNQYYKLNTSYSAWSNEPPSTLDGLISSTIRYETGQISIEANGTTITSVLDPTTKEIVSGVYSTSVCLEGHAVSLTIQAGNGDIELVPHSITSVLFIDSLNSDVLADYDQTPFQTSFKGLGLQLHHSYTDSSGFHQQKIVLWTYDGQYVQSISRNISFDLSESHDYTFSFTTEQLGLTYRRKVDVFIDGTLYATLFGVPRFSSSNSKMILHLFNRHGYLPPCDPTCAANPPRVVSIFSNVSLHISTGQVCDYGEPFYNWGSPFISLEAAVGSRPGLSDVKEFEIVSSPCTPCRPNSCFQYGCTPSCPTGSDPLTVSFTFSYVNDSEVASGIDTDGFLSNLLQPLVYYITVRATSGSGQIVTSSSNGILIDVTPPILSLPIQHYDVSFSRTQPTVYQGNNHTISASWSFGDPESGIVEYSWAIGTTKFSEDIQMFTNVGLNTRAYNDSLNGVLIANTTYYVTVLARNGAGLSQVYSSVGITYLLIQLNQTMLDLLTVVQHVDVIHNVLLNGKVDTVFRSNRDDSVGVEWLGIPSDISTIYWSIGSEVLQSDILPSIDVSYNNAHIASISAGTLYLDDTPFSNISHVLALADGSDPGSIGGLYLEPGRVLFHTLEFCTFAHNCERSESQTAIIIRNKDAQIRSAAGEDVTVNIRQVNPTVQNISVLDKNYTLTLTTKGGLQSGTILYAGFLSDVQVKYSYRVALPYISNPYVTMDRTSRDIARRLVSIGGASFYVSLLGQDNLDGELMLNVSFDTTLDWSESEPRLVYWDIDEGVWREVKNTCGMESKIDFTSGTISVDVCSTALPGSDTSNRPDVLTRRRRVTDDMSGAGMNATLTEFLDRPTHFVVMQFGNFSLNTAPQLQLPSLVELNEDVTLFTFTIPFTDNEGDTVWFYLTSVATIGSAIIDNSTGVLSYIPCRNCTGIESIRISIVEKELEFGTELSDAGVLQLQVNNVDDLLNIFLFDGNDSISHSNDITVYIDANTTVPVVVGRIGSYDIDGYSDDMEVFINGGSRGTSSYVTWLDVVAVPESLPVNWGELPIGRFNGYVAFLGVNIMYLLNDVNFVGTDQLSIYGQQEDGTFSQFLTISIDVIPSWCVNGGSCNGTASDLSCSNIEARKINPESYTCTCPTGYTGDYCQIAPPTSKAVSPACPDNIPLFTCDGDPCSEASCPGYPAAVCVPDYCGHCHAVWYVGEERVTCSAVDLTVCRKPQSDALIPFCASVSCECPLQHFTCPDDAVFVETRTGPCCVRYSCECSKVSCPHLMECGHGVQPVPTYQGGRYPGRCCSSYLFEDINECVDTAVKTCSDICMNEAPFFSCQCPNGKTLASDAKTCGVCYHGGVQYLYGDTVQIGCNWCVCQSDILSGERWHCTAHSCTPACYYNGTLYSPNSQLSVGSISCTCRLTDKSAEWSCN